MDRYVVKGLAWYSCAERAITPFSWARLTIVFQGEIGRAAKTVDCIHIVLHLKQLQASDKATGDDVDDRAQWGNKITFIIRSFNIIRKKKFIWYLFYDYFLLKFEVQVFRFVCMHTARTHARTYMHAIQFPLRLFTFVRQIENNMYEVLKFNVYA